jgi:hypothetical protein
MKSQLDIVHRTKHSTKNNKQFSYREIQPPYNGGPQNKHTAIDASGYLPQRVRIKISKNGVNRTGKQNNE